MYFTYRIFQGLEAQDTLEEAVGLFSQDENRERFGDDHFTVFSGNDCAAVYFGGSKEIENRLRELRSDKECINMDVNFVDHDAWEVNLYSGSEFLAHFNTNPWQFDQSFKVDEKELEENVEIICKAWPSLSEEIRPYLRLWREPSRSWLGFTKLRAIEGKAHDNDQYEYKDAFQLHDFLRKFGVDPGNWYAIYRIASREIDQQRK